jgi:hypothetical protein
VTNEKERNRVVGQKKLQLKSNDICKDLPAQFSEALDYIRSLEFKSDPDYDFLIGLFKNVSKEQNFEFDGQYDWIADAKKLTTPKT